MNIRQGKCPKCEKLLTRVKAEDVAIEAGSKQWNGISYSCPFCSVILNVSIDPIALKTDIVREVCDGLKKQKQ